MPKSGPIILVEDDFEDQEITREAIRQTGVENELIVFSTCDDCYNFLINMGPLQPFIILSDVNLPKMSGLDFKERIDKNETLRKKSIPFIFYSTSVDRKSVAAAYEYRVQGYFAKESSMKDMKETLQLVFDYWQKCKHPNN
jgi:DNA-binding NarL/FixJ family response regulator